jgi:hypothetical protein
LGFASSPQPTGFEARRGKVPLHTRIFARLAIKIFDNAYKFILAGLCEIAQKQALVNPDENPLFFTMLGAILTKLK